MRHFLVRGCSAALTALFVIAMLAGLLYLAPPAQAVSTIHILNDSNGGDCVGLGWTWDPMTLTCTMAGDLETSDIDAIHVEGDGLTLDGVGHTVTGNGVGNGVTIGGFSDVTIRSVHLFGYSQGIVATGATRPEIVTCDVRNSAIGIYMNGSVDGFISNNSLTENGSAVYLGTSSATNLVTQNTFTGNSIGIYVFAANSNTITHNTVQSSSYCGISINYSTGNIVYSNVLTGNAAQAETTNTGGNIFDSGPDLGGNYWSDWVPPAHPDGDGDGFVDEPYVVNGATGEQDNLPLASPTGWDRTAPDISNIQPTGTVRSGNPALTAYYSDPTLSSGIDTSSASVSFTDYPWQVPGDYVCTATGSPFGSISCSQQGSPLYPLPQGHYEFQVSIADAEGNTGSASGSFDIQAYRITDAPGGQDCPLFGAWDAGSKTCTMTMDLNVADLDGMYISSDGITLDGNGHNLTCTNTLGSLYWGPIIEGRTGVTIKNLTVTGFYAGIFLPGASGNTLTGNLLTGNTIGAFIPGSESGGADNNTVIGNDMSGNTYAGLYLIEADNSRVVNNTFTGNSNMCVITDADAARANTGMSFSGNACSGSPTGFALSRTNDSRFIGNTVHPEWHGFTLYECDGNRFERNEITGGDIIGFAGWGSSDDDINEFFNNSFIKPTGQFTPFNLSDVSNEGNVFNREFGGGNYYSWHDTTAEGCPDANNDDFCDSAYGQDAKPWTVQGGWQPEYHWTWYDNLYARNWVLMANPEASVADSWFDLTVAGDDLNPGGAPGEIGLVPPGDFLAEQHYDESSAGLIGGPVEVNWRGDGGAITSQRIIWAGNSLEEVPGFAAARLTDHYYWTWYDMQSPGFRNWVLVANPNLTDIYYEIRIAGELRASGRIWGGENVAPTFPGVKGGPVEVQAWTDASKTAPADVMASQRVLTNNDSAFNEVTGIPAEELATSYVWTWYDEESAGAKDWVLVANPKNYPIYYEITIAGDASLPGSTGELAPSGQPGDIFTGRFGTMGGPVEVRFWKDSVGGDLVTEGIASQRTIWGPSFEEVPGYPLTALASTYHWTWYDQLSPGMTNWVLVAHQYADNITAEISFTDSASGEIVTLSHDITPAERQWAPTFPGQMGGPVTVKAWHTDGGAPADVIVSQRVLYNGFFNEVEGTVLS